MRAREIVCCGVITLGMAGCAAAPEVPWCAADPTHRDARAASRVSPETVRLDWAKSCVDAFGRYAARTGMRVVVTYTPPAAAPSEDMSRVQSLRTLIDDAPTPAMRFELRARHDTKGLTDDDGLIIIDLADR